MDRGEFFVSMEIFERALNFKWEVIIVYGPADHSRSPTFLAELQQKISASLLPVVVGGDFNLLRSAAEKSNSRIDPAESQWFNDWVADIGLRELDRVGARFTWTNRQVSPTLSVLDRVFVSPDWELRFPLASLQAITRIGFDHVPLLIHVTTTIPRSNLFKFEPGWVSFRPCGDILNQIWASQPSPPSNAAASLVAALKQSRTASKNGRARAFPPSSAKPAATLPSLP